MNLSDLLKFADTNVSLGSVLVVLAIVYFAFSFVKRTVVGIFMGVGGLLSRFHYTMVSAGLMSIMGLTGLGYGIGELRTGDPIPEQVTPLTNQQLVDLTKQKDVNPEVLKQILAYTDKRDGVQVNMVSTGSVQAQPAEKPIYRTAWTAIIGGFGFLLVGVVTFFVKVNGYMV
jgi:hypothetical protein